MHHVSVLSLCLNSLSQHPVTHKAETGEVSQGSKRQGAAPQAFSSLLLDIEDVDSADAGDPQMCSEYVRDIYSYLQDLEVRVWKGVISITNSI